MHKDWDLAGQAGVDPKRAAEAAWQKFEEKAKGKQEEKPAGAAKPQAEFMPTARTILIPGPIL